MGKKQEKSYAISKLHTVERIEKNKMQLTIFGIAIIALSIYAFIKNNEKLLLYMLVFLSTFTAASVFNVTLIRMPALTFEYVGAVWMLRVLINIIKSKPKINKEIIIKSLKENKLAVAFIIFIIVTILSEIALIVIQRKGITYQDLDETIKQLRFSFGNIKQLLIIIYLFVLMTFLSYRIKSKDEIKDLLRIFGISTVFAVVWGLLQFVITYFKIPYPDFLFNTNIYAAQGFNQMNNNVKRISGIALEPSTFSIHLICFLPFILGAFLAIKTKLKEKNNLIIIGVLLLTTICAILTTSSTAYVGLLFIYGAYGIYCLFGVIKNGEMYNKKKNVLKIIIAGIVAIIIASAVCVVSVKIGYKLGAINYIEVTQPDDKPSEEKQTTTKPKYDSPFINLAKTIKEMTINKLTSESGEDRMSREAEGFKMFQYSPVFGVGLGSFRTFTLFTNILLNIGIVGIVSYAYILFVVIKELIEYRKKEESISIMFLMSILGTSLCLCISVPDFVLTYYWMIIVFAYKYTTIKD